MLARDWLLLTIVLCSNFGQSLYLSHKFEFEMLGAVSVYWEICLIFWICSAKTIKGFYTLDWNSRRRSVVSHEHPQLKCHKHLIQKPSMRNQNPMQWGTTMKEASHQALRVAKFFCWLHLTKTYLLIPVAPYGPSMLPTFKLTGDTVLGERISTRLGKLRVGDIVLVKSPENPRKEITKRVKGLEGDTVTYLVDPKRSDQIETVVVPKGHIWIEGDNIYDSKDSRHFGPVPYGLVTAREFWRIWPMKSFGPLDNQVRDSSSS